MKLHLLHSRFSASHWTTFEFLFYTSHSYTLNNSPFMKVKSKFALASFGSFRFRAYGCWWEYDRKSDVTKMRVYIYIHIGVYISRKTHLHVGSLFHYIVHC